MKKLFLCLIPFILFSCSSHIGFPVGRIYAESKTSSETADNLIIKEYWREIEIALERRCTPYNRDDYRYPQSLEPEIVKNNWYNLLSLYRPML